MFGHALSPPDPFLLNDTFFYPRSMAIWRGPAAPRAIAVDPGIKTLILYIAGQSQMTNLMPTVYTPAHTQGVSHFNVYDGAFYPVTGALLGSTYDVTGVRGLGNIAARIADKLVDAGWDQVLIVNVAVGGTVVDQWATICNDRIPVAIRRLAARGITTSSPGTHHALLWAQGESDTYYSTSQAAYTASLNQVLSQIAAAGFSGRIFINKETYFAGAVSSAVQNAQLSFANGSTIFNGADLDALGSGYRQPDNVHFNDAGAEAAATAIVAAMVASGAPF